MYYINDSITSITTKWLSHKVEANKLWSWGEAEKSRKFQIQYKEIKFTGHTCVPCIRLWAPLLLDYDEYFVASLMSTLLSMLAFI